MIYEIEEVLRRLFYFFNRASAEHVSKYVQFSTDVI